ncbi:MAG: hypothetical protein ACRET6_02890 [Burkholderiales bacterium]
MSKRNLALASIVALTLAGTLPALAQTAPAKKSKEETRAAFEARFKAADKNSDGGLTKAELGDGKQFPAILKNFDAMDANKDGKVTAEEHHAWGKANRAAKK